MGPATPFSRLHLRGWCPSYIRIDCLEDGEQMGADFMAGSLWYFLMCYYGLYGPCMFRAACDGLYYGPQVMGPASVAIISALCLF